MRWARRRRALPVLPKHALAGTVAAIALAIVPVMAACGGGTAAPGQTTAPHSGSSAGKTSPGQATAPIPAPHSGSWAGKTSQGKPISFSVSGDFVKKLTIEYVHPGSACTVSSASIQVDVLDITDGKFNYAEGGDEFAGSFTSGTEASGTAHLVPQAADRPACQVASITWNAQWTGH